MVASNSLVAVCTLGLAALAAAYSKPVGPTPKGNSLILPSQGEQVTVGKPYTITWEPTTPGTVTLYLCIGPSTNCQTQDVPFADHVENSGTYSWTPPPTLAPTEGKGYGIQLVVDEGPYYGQYQYTPQFGVTNNKYSSEEPSSAPPTSTPGGYPTETPTSHPPAHNSTATDAPTTPYPTHHSTVKPSHHYNATVTPTKLPTIYTSVVDEPTETGAAGGNETATGAPPEQTGAAAAKAAGTVGMSFAALVAAFFAL